MKVHLVIATLVASVFAQDAVEKSVINYQGTDFLLLDGCPDLKGCNTDACDRERSALRQRYTRCLQSQRGQDVGCVTTGIGKLPEPEKEGEVKRKGQVITLPVYASMCAAMCYEPTPAKLATVHPCPHPGFRLHDPDLERLFG